MAMNFIVIENFFENLFYFAITCPPSDHITFVQFSSKSLQFPDT